MIEFIIHIIPTVLILGVLIFIHELGHFLACRLAGVGVEKFSIGFGPELLTWKGKETRYAVSLIPLGGFVKPKGETYEEIKERGVSDPHDFLAASRWNRFLILVAGVAMNFIFAYVLFVSVMVVGRPVLSPKIGGFIEGYPAQTSGFQVGDQVTHLNGIRVANWQDLTLQILQGHGGEPLNFSVLREGVPQAIRVVPQVEEGHDIFGKSRRVPRIGIKPTEEFTIERYSLGEALVKSAQFELRLTALTYEALWHLVTGRLSLRSISGPIGIVSMAGSAAKMGVVALLQFTAILSVSLAVINLLPIPALDGGHLFFLILEVVRRKQVSLAFQERMTQIGFYFLMSLMLLVVYNDLVNIGAVDKIKSIFFRSG
ncbi:MAG: RIP metalloprotease RseP [Candidatus Omnitrophica bacterium]|nr:RIP metalloprotease RseP [Candidatus Omnitrophota bacterium]